ncbi:ComEC/Rec2 family competence protein [Spirosoma rigui]|uniref:ComEC/Rec2 family competence protein n=1 Tax=Spirosoma rigui TaxID=564064 RepID=UPI0009B18082|nr:ComEC/Rec2 family competence protein [Spirosoma rigui]
MTRHPFVRYTLGFVLGILFYVYLPDWYALPWVAAGVGGTLLVRGYLRYRKQHVKPIQALQGIGGLLVLGALGWVTTYQHTASNRPDNLLNRTDTLYAYVGIVAAQPEERAKTYRVELDLQRGRFGPGKGLPEQVSSHWQRVSGRVIVYLDKQGTTQPRYGEMWLVSGSPRPIDPPLNPGEFDYRRYLRYRSIYHQQYLRPFQRRILASRPPNPITQVATSVNRWADSVFTQQVGSRAEYGIVNAMILGVRDDLDTEMYRVYSVAGAVHILSVSGMHVGILFSVLTLLLGFLLKRPRGKWLMAVLQLLILWFYTLATGFSPPVLRSAAMFTILILANASGRQQQLANTLGVSAFFILCYDPYALFSAGFQLSYLAVAGIGAWQSPLFLSLTFRYKLVNRLWEITAVAIVAQLITFPLGVFYFHQFPTYFLLANPAVMVLSFLLLPLAMVVLAVSGVPYVNEWLGWCLQKLAWLLNATVTQTSLLPGAAWEGLWLSPGALLLLYAMILCSVAALVYRNQQYIWATYGAALLLAGLLVWDDYGQRHQQKIAVHFLPHRTAVSLTGGRASILLTDLDTADRRSYDFYLKNTFGQWGVTALTVAPVRQSPGLSARSPAGGQTPDYGLWVWRGKTLLLVNNLSGRNRWKLPAIVDYLIIRRNALRDWDQLTGRVVARHIIFDDSNKTPLTDRLLREADARGIACFSVRQMGAYVADLD